MIFKINDRYFDKQKYDQKITLLKNIINEDITPILCLNGCSPIDDTTWLHEDLDILIHLTIIPRSQRIKV